MPTVSRNIAELVVKLRDEISSNAENASKRIRALEMNIQSIQRGALAAAAALTAVGGTLFAVTKSSADYADEIGKAAQRTGTTTEFLSALRHAGNLADVTFEDLSTGLVKFNSSVFDAARGTGEAEKAFRALGIEIKNADGSLRSNDILLEDLADRFQAMPDGIQKSALAVDILGKSGARMIPLLNGGRAGIAAATEEAKKFGKIVTDEAAKAAEEFNDNMTRMTAAVTGLKQRLGNELIPVFQRLLDMVARVAKIPLPGLETRILEGSIRDLDRMIAAVELRLDKLSDATDPFFDRERARLRIQLEGLRRERADFQDQIDRLSSGSGQKPSATELPIRNEEADKVTDSLKKQLGALAAQRIALTEGDEAAQRYKLTHELLAQLKGKTLPESIKKLIEQIIRETAEFEKLKTLYEQTTMAAVAYREEQEERALADKEYAEGLKRINEFLAERKRLEEERAAKLFEQDAEELARAGGEREAIIIGAIKKREDAYNRIKERGAEADFYRQLFGEEDINQKIADVRAALEDLRQAGVSPLDDEVQKLKDNLKGLEQVQTIEHLVKGAFDGISTSLKGVIMGTQSLEDAMKNMGRNAALALTDLIFRLTIVDPLIRGITNALGGVSGGQGGKKSDPIGDLIGSAVSSGFGFVKSILGFQEGGTVPGPMGAPRLAVVHGGEEVIPAGDNKGRPLINQYFDFRKAERGVSFEVKREIRMAMKQTKLEAVAEVRERKLRGGNYGRTLGSS